SAASFSRLRLPSGSALDNSSAAHLKVSSSVPPHRRLKATKPSVTSDEPRLQNLAITSGNLDSDIAHSAKRAPYSHPSQDQTHDLSFRDCSTRLQRLAQTETTAVPRRKSRVCFPALHCSSREV